jgi:pimeloyl-ACP methyl ester carboxylesterase
MLAKPPHLRLRTTTGVTAWLLLVALAAGAAGAPGRPAAPAVLDPPRPQSAGAVPAPPGPNTAPAPQPPRRPQEPAPPFPYVQREVGYDNGPIHLAGTLTLPEGRGPFPAVLLITGSGAQNRDEEIFGHKPFLVLADHLTRADIAVLRVDDRGVGGSTGDTGSSTTADFAADALAGVRFLASQPEIFKDRIGLLGHSEGGLVAALAASRSREVAFVVLLGTSGVPGYDLLVDQVEATARAAGAPEATAKQLVALERQALDAIRAEKDEAALRAKLTPILRAAAELAAPGQRAAGGDLDAAVERQVKASTSPWFRFFLSFDPRPVLRQVSVPVLAVGGNKDVQVPAARNLPAIERALQQGGAKDITIRRIPELNHLFQHAKTGSPAEYGAIEETFDPDLLGIITRWILARFGGRPAAPAAPAPAPAAPPPPPPP